MSDEDFIILISAQSLLSEYQVEKLMPFIRKTDNEFEAASFAIEASKQGYSALDIIEFFKDGDWQERPIFRD